MSLGGVLRRAALAVLGIQQAAPESRAPTYDIGSLSYATGAVQVRRWDGEKFLDGFGCTEEYELDYWTLRKRSIQLFTSNLYARGLVRRLVTNEIGIGIFPDVAPIESVLGLEEDSLEDWIEDVETRFALWADHAQTADYRERATFAMLQAEARQTALIEGDVLVVLRSDAGALMPRVQLINGARVQSPGLTSGTDVPGGHEVKHGVELDAVGRIVAHWILQDDGEFQRLPAFAEITGRPLSWLVYGTDKRMGDVRGVPLLSLVLQSLRELDRYRDAVTRKAVVNSYLAMFIKKTKDKPGSLPMTGGAVRKDVLALPGTDTAPAREWAITKHTPGMVVEELQQGEEPQGFGTEGIDLDFGKFEEAIVSTMAWAYQLPPEILKLAFSSNYSASAAAINELKTYLRTVWKTFGATFCAPIYRDWLLSLTLAQRVKAPGLAKAYGDPAQADAWAAWTACEWYGTIKPSTDMLKLVKASEILVHRGWSTNALEARMLNGTKFRANLKKLRRENEAWVESQAPLVAAQLAASASDSESSGGGEGSGPEREPSEDSESDALDQLEAA